LERVWIEAISLLMLSRAAVKTLGTGMFVSIRVLCTAYLGHSVLRSAEGVECALDRMAWVERSIHNGQNRYFFFLPDAECVSRSLTLLLESLDDLANSLRSMSVRLLCHWILETSVATYIFDSGVLVDLALQVLEDTLTEKRVCRHDCFVCVVCCSDVWNCFVG
jgi:hypothetical protein